MNNRKTHKIIGLILLLPMLGWTITGLIFFIKPGYKQAYEQLSLKTYPIEKAFTIPYVSQWTEVKLIRSILGHHLLVNDEGKVKHLDPVTLVEVTKPSKTDLKVLIEDALSKNSERYGKVLSITGDIASTSKGIDITLNWNNLTLRQTGFDTKLINFFYKVHYLQWTPFKSVNQVLGIVGLILLTTLTILGVKIYIDNNRKTTP